MFTEGLDESALNWVKQGSDKELLQVRSPLRETSIDNDYLMPKSPLSFNSPTYKSSNILPPLKFHSGLLLSHNLEIKNFNECEDEYDFDEYDGHDDHESVGSASDEMDYTYFEEEEINEVMLNVNPVNVSGPVGLNKSTLNRGTIKEDLYVEVPQKTRKFTETGWHGGASTMLSSVSAASHLCDMLQPHCAYGTPTANLGTPSAPPIYEGVEHIILEVEGESSKEYSRITQ